MILARIFTKIFKEGKVLLLDDSFIHGVKNSNTQSRYTLMISCWHPELTKLDIALLKQFYKIAKKFQ